jgi:hypothetical protein
MFNVPGRYRLSAHQILDCSWFKDWNLVRTTFRAPYRSSFGVSLLPLTEISPTE